MCEPFLENKFTEQKKLMFNSATGLLSITQEFKASLLYIFP